MKILIATLFSTLLFSGLASAQETPAKETPKANENTKGLSHEDLGTMLEDLGYEPKTIKMNDGGKRYLVKMSRDTWNFNIAVELSPNRSFVWLSGNLGKLPEGDNLKRDLLLKLLESNHENSPRHFLVKSNRQLSLEQPITVAHMTPADLSSQIDTFVEQIKGTHSIWGPLTKPAEPAKTAVK